MQSCACDTLAMISQESHEYHRGYHRNVTGWKSTVDAAATDGELP